MQTCYLEWRVISHPQTPLLQYGASFMRLTRLCRVLGHQYGAICFLLDCLVCFVSFSVVLSLLRYFKVLGGLDSGVVETIWTMYPCWNLIHFVCWQGTNDLTLPLCGKDWIQVLGPLFFWDLCVCVHTLWI